MKKSDCSGSRGGFRANIGVIGASIAVGCLILFASAASAQTETLKLWPGTAPGDKGDIGPETMLESKPDAKRAVARLSNVTEPRIEVYPAPKDKNSGAAIVVCPGGAYGILAIEHEGTLVIEWLNSIGVNGILLKYRVPRRVDREKHEAPLQDTQRAMGLVRKNAARWGIDPERIGMLGFSAGGHLVLTTGTNYGKRTYEKIDDADEFSCRPDFLIPVYPAYLVEKGDEGKLPPEIRVNADTPPIFFAHADNDPHSAEGSARVYIELKRAGVPAELHIYAKGGHGFGMFESEDPVSSWPQRCGEWMRSMGYLGEE